MKKSFIMCLLLVMSIFMVSCKKDDPQQQEKLKDTIAPYIEVSFFSEIVIECCDEYNLLEGVKAIDNIERFITERIIVDDGGFDPKKAGTYIITYNVKDSDGNPAEPYVRKIIVVDTKKALLVAHRGGKGVGLENTIEAFVGAYEKGYYAVECDIQETSDGELVVYHDLNISRLTGIDQNVKNCTLEYLQSLTYTKKETDGKIYTGSMLSFKDFIKFIANHNIHAFIELKETSTETTIDKALAIINEQKISEDKYTIIGNSSSVDMLIYLRTISKTMNLQFVAKTDYQLYTESCLLNNIGLDISIDCFSTDKTLAMSTIQKLKDKGLTLNFWVVNKTTDLIKYLGLGANYITTDSIEPSK